MNTHENICALSTGVSGAIAIVRISGDGACGIGNAVWQGKELLSSANARKMLLGKIGGDRALAVYFAAPGSYTGEEMVELHSHGGLRATRAVLNRCLEAGCRMAEPGEYTYRAFLNGKLDLAQAEAVGDLIGAGSDRARCLAERQLAGSLSREIGGLRESLIHCAAECEAHLDFDAEEPAYDEGMASKLEAVRQRIDALLQTARCGGVLRAGVKLVIAGRPNAGKSSLLNRLLGYERAIVTDIAGTTRDTIAEKVSLREIPTILIDTAGLRQSADPVEKRGVELSLAAMEQADVILYLLDGAADPERELAAFRDLALQQTKVIAGWSKGDLALPLPAEPALKISVMEPDGIEAFLDAFAAKVWQQGASDAECAVNFRHEALLRDARRAVEESLAEIGEERFETAASGLHQAIHALGAITGETADPDLLGEIFSRFCIGK